MSDKDTGCMLKFHDSHGAQERGVHTSNPLHPDPDSEKTVLLAVRKGCFQVVFVYHQMRLFQELSA
jgi:hypothetical protein